MSLLAGSVSNVPSPTLSPRSVAAVPVLESRKRCHTDRQVDQVALQLDEEMVIEEGPLLHEGTVSGEDQGPDEGTVSGEDQGPDPDIVTEDGTEDDEHAVGETANDDLAKSIEALRSDIQSIKIDGNRLGETVLSVQRDIHKMRSEMITKECFDQNLRQMVTQINSQLDSQKTEIDHYSGEIIDIREDVNDVKAKLETCLVTQDQHDENLTRIEETVLEDMLSFKKELQGFEDRLCKVVPRTPFLPTSSDQMPHINEMKGQEIPTTKTQIQPQVEKKQLIIEGLYEYPLEDLEE